MASSESDDDNTPQIPLFNGKKYYYWKYRMYSFLAGYHSDELDAIEDGPFVPTHIVDGITKEKPKTQWTDDDKKKVRIGYRAKSLLLSALSYDQFYDISECVTAQEVWNKLRDVHEGTGQVKLAKIDLLTCQYERFCMKPGESVKDMIMRFCDLFNHLASLGKKYADVDLVYKVLRSLSREWRHKVRTIEESRNLSTMPLSALFRELEEHEELMLNELAEKEAIRKKKLNSGRAAALSRKDDEEYDSDDSQKLEEHEELVLNELAEKEATRKKKLNRGRVATLSRKDDEEYDSDDSEEMDLLIKDFVKFLLKEKNFKKGKKEHKKRGSSSTRTIF